MTAKRWDGSSQQDISTAKRWDGSSWVNITTAKRWDGNAWHDITFAGGGGGGGLSAVASGNANGRVFNNQPTFASVVSITTNPVTVTASGGTGPYTYKWTRFGGDNRANCNSPNSSTTTWTANIYQDDFSESVWRCTVTDSIGNTVYVDVMVELSYTTGGPKQEGISEFDI